MPLPSSVHDRCRTFLGTGERIRYLVPAMSLSIHGMAGAAQFLIMVTDRHVTVLACGRFRMFRPKSIWERLPRGTELGPVDVHPSLGPAIRVAGLELEIGDEYVAVLRAADAEVAGVLPEDPFG